MPVLRLVMQLIGFSDKGWCSHSSLEFSRAYPSYRFCVEKHLRIVAFRKNGLSFGTTNSVVPNDKQEIYSSALFLQVADCDR